MTRTYWNEPLDPNSCIEYNKQHFTLSSLDRPGTEGYFNSVMASLRREVESRGKPKPNGGGTKVRVERSEPKKLSPQRCYKCSRLLRAEKCYAAVELPIVVCLKCFSSKSKYPTIDSRSIRFEMVRVLK